MEKLTHFKINNEKEIDALFQEKHRQIDLHERDFKTVFKTGKKIVECNLFGRINLTDDLDPRSKKISNPYLSHPVEEENLDPQQKGFAEDDLEPLAEKSDRRKRVDHIFDIIGFDIDADKLSKIIEVIDFDNEYGDKAQYGMILKLK